MRDKILIVDDEADIVSMLKDYFEFNGYDTLTALSGPEAIKKAEMQPDICPVWMGWRSVCRYGILCHARFCS